ncbi:MAG: DUF3817 domain-containing protein [Cytophagales bacterium]|nr:MAG: DUF3817 domain-containing protein [Cytophagales bacterium]
MIAKIEGWSYLLLIAIAMPLKYFFNYPYLIRPIGMAHGVLFIAYMVYLVVAFFKYQWSVQKAILLFIVSLIPLGTFLWEKHYKE